MDITAIVTSNCNTRSIR